MTKTIASTNSLFLILILQPAYANALSGIEGFANFMTIIIIGTIIVGVIALIGVIRSKSKLPFIIVLMLALYALLWINVKFIK